MIDRRTALAGVAGLFGTQLFAPIARAAATAVPGGTVPVISEGAPSAPVFSTLQRALVSALSERVIPTTDTPGAIAAGVPAFIEKFLADWSAPAERTPVLNGLFAIDAQARREHGVAAADATPEQQDALLTLAMNGQLPHGAEFFLAFRQLVITGYYTSEIGITKEREYLPVPGRYDGAFPYSNVNKVYSA